MRLLLDQNLAPGLARRIADLFPGTRHVREVGLRDSNDLVIWEYARQDDLTIVTKDADFRELCHTRGAPPPRVVWIRIGNCSVAHVEAVLREHAAEIESLGIDPVQMILIIE